MVSPRPHSYAGGAQRGISLATGFFTGESRRKPVGGSQLIKRRDISSLHNHDLGLLDSFGKSTKSSLPNPLGQIHLAKSSPSDTFKNGCSARDGRVFAPRQVVAFAGQRVAARSLLPSSAAVHKCGQRHLQCPLAMWRLERRRQPSERCADCSGRTKFAPLRRPGSGLTLCALSNNNDSNEADVPMRQR